MYECKCYKCGFTFHSPNKRAVWCMRSVCENRVALKSVEGGVVTGSLAAGDEPKTYDLATRLTKLGWTGVVPK